MKIKMKTYVENINIVKMNMSRTNTGKINIEETYKLKKD
jgi:hypothetical protein